MKTKKKNLRQIIKRARSLRAECHEPLQSFLYEEKEFSLDEFCSIDDSDVIMAIKKWCAHEDMVLSMLCKGIINRNLLKVRYFPQPISQELINVHRAEIKLRYGLSDEDTEWLVFTGEASSTTYDFENEHIYILYKDGSTRDISEIDNALISENVKGKVKKYYICFLR